jgi:hypothetical protein
MAEPLNCHIEWQRKGDFYTARKPGPPKREIQLSPNFKFIFTA